MVEWIKSFPPEVLATIIVSILGFAGIFITQWTMFCIAHMRQTKTQRDVELINDAVNHRHKKRQENGGVPPKLFDLAWDNHQKVDELVKWKRSYDGGYLDHGDKVTEFVDYTHDAIGLLTRKIDDVEEKSQQRHELAESHSKERHHHAIDIIQKIEKRCAEHPPCMHPDNLVEQVVKRVKESQSQEPEK